MLRLQQINSTSDKYFEPLIKLYEEAFPPNERRDVDKIKDLVFSTNGLSINAIIDNEVLCGLMIYWKFKDFYYLEHFAIFPEMRNRKIGERTLGLIKDIAKGETIVLEAEPADNELAMRRIEFYKRNGFSILRKNYIQPPYSKEKEGLHLWMLGIIGKNNNIDCISNTIKQNVYFIHYF